MSKTKWIFVIWDRLTANARQYKPLRTAALPQFRLRRLRVRTNLFGLTNFGINLTRLAPNTVSALRHAYPERIESRLVRERTALVFRTNDENPWAHPKAVGSNLSFGLVIF